MMIDILISKRKYFLTFNWWTFHIVILWFTIPRIIKNDWVGLWSWFGHGWSLQIGICSRLISGTVIDYCANCGILDEHPWSMCNIHFRREIRLFYPSPTSRMCILSMLINLTQTSLLLIVVIDVYLHWQKKNTRHASV